VPAEAEVTERPDVRENPSEEAPWAMQVVLRLERNDVPTRTQLCEAAAAAVVMLISDARSQPGGPWEESVQRWVHGRIRKIVRRARGAKWDATAALDHVEVDRAGAQVRVFLPGPMDAVPDLLAKLQLSGTEPPELGEPAPELHGGVTVFVTPEVSMTVGKAAAQCGHAAQLAWRAMDPGRRTAWADAGFPVRVEHPDRTRWAELAETAPVAVADAGFTEIAPGTVTTLAMWAGPGASGRHTY
jgi:peptidyl-tRNA hydrolase